MQETNVYAEVIVLCEEEIEEGVTLQHRLLLHEQNVLEGSRLQAILVTSNPQGGPKHEVLVDMSMLGSRWLRQDDSSRDPNAVLRDAVLKRRHSEQLV